MIVINLAPGASVHLPSQHTTTSSDTTAATCSSTNPPSKIETSAASRSRSHSVSLRSSSRSASPASTARRSTPRTSSAAYLRLQQQEQQQQPQSQPPAPLQPRPDPLTLKYDVPVDVAIPAFAKPSNDVERDLGRIYEAISGARRIAVICGAGISVSSPANIPDFRSATGLFKKLKEKYPTAGLTSGKDLFDARLFNSETTSALFYTMIAELKQLADQAEPTIFHRLLKRLDQEGRLQRVYTQNIDALEEKVGLTFGLGDTGDSTTTVRALGKRKRQGGSGTSSATSRSSAWSRSKSDSHLLLSNRQPLENQEVDDKPMFPRAIPLHGTLQTLTCALCSYKLYLANTTRCDDLAPPRGSREGSASLGHEESIKALELLQSGEPVPCPHCAEFDQSRQLAGLRSRGVGRMKVDIVLYGGQNEGAERVGECLQRDILGLRDPLEPPVPENAAETRARERRERKAEEKARIEQEKEQKLQQPQSEFKANQMADTRQEDATIVDAQLRQDLSMSMDTEMDKDDILAREFADNDEDAFPADPSPSIPPTKEMTVTFAEPSTRSVSKNLRAPRLPRLKPLPPDLLIVAGTSLKVPGTKRIVREFAKACHAKDQWVIYSDSDNEENSDEDKGKAGSRRSSSAESEAKANDKQDDQDDEENDPTHPIRTILLNYDFPNPCREWEEVFDVWIQGDLQRAALGLFPSQPVDPDSTPEAKTIEQVVDQHSWAPYLDYLEEQRKDFKKKSKSARSATMTRAVSFSAASKKKAEPSKSKANPTLGKIPLVRSQSDAPLKKKRNIDTEDGGMKSLGRSISKKGILSLFGKKGSTVASRGGGGSIKNDEKGNQGQIQDGAMELLGKAQGGASSKGKAGSSVSTTRRRSEVATSSIKKSNSSKKNNKLVPEVVVMSSMAPPTPPPSVQSADSTPEPQEQEGEGEKEERGQDLNHETHGNSCDVSLAEIVVQVPASTTPYKKPTGTTTRVGGCENGSIAKTKQMQLKGLGRGVKPTTAYASQTKKAFGKAFAHNSIDAITTATTTAAPTEARVIIDGVMRRHTRSRSMA